MLFWSAAGTGTVASDDALMFPQSSPLLIVWKLVSAGSRFSLARCPGGAVPIFGLLEVPMFAAILVLVEWSVVTAPVSATARSTVPLAVSFAPDMVAERSEIGLRDES